jgi:hypothetical protein
VVKLMMMKMRQLYCQHASKDDLLDWPVNYDDDNDPLRSLHQTQYSLVNDKVMLDLTYDVLVMQMVLAHHMMLLAQIPGQNVP